MHFHRAYLLSEGKLGLVVDPASGRIGHYLPASIQELEETLQSHKIAGRGDVKQSLEAMAKATRIEIKPESSLFYDSIAYYPPFAYAPHVAAIAIARMLELPILYVYYARVSAVLFLRCYHVFVDQKCACSKTAAFDDSAYADKYTTGHDRKRRLRYYHSDSYAGMLCDQYDFS